MKKVSLNYRTLELKTMHRAFKSQTSHHNQPFISSLLIQEMINNSKALSNDSNSPDKVLELRNSLPKEIEHSKTQNLPDCPFARENISFSHSSKRKDRNEEENRTSPPSRNFAKALQLLRKRKEVNSHTRELQQHLGEDPEKMPLHDILFGNKTKLNFRIKHRTTK
jgi:hypothetical protein